MENLKYVSKGLLIKLWIGFLSLNHRYKGLQNLFPVLKFSPIQFYYEVFHLQSTHPHITRQAFL